MKISLTSVGKTNENFETLTAYLEFVKGVLRKQTGSQNIWEFVVLPEYCWGDIDQSSWQHSISELQSSLAYNQVLVAGSFSVQRGPSKYNMALVLNEAGIVAEIPKEQILSDEQGKSEVMPGRNPGIIEIGNLKVGIIICADIWSHHLLYRILVQQKADLLLVPAFTVVPPGLGGYARTQWHSLAIVRSREYIIPIAIADHESGTTEYDVGAATCIVDPSLKNSKMQSAEDFLHLSQDNVVSVNIDLASIGSYRSYRREKGIFSN